MIKFISYTGKYPNLCSGVLTVEIDGKEYKFGHETGSYDFLNDRYKDDNFEKFWTSGGSVERDENWNMWATDGDWELNYYKNEFPQWIIDLFPQLIKVFNENVPGGCCGGCI